MKKKVTIAEIAKEMGLATSTVSRALKDSPSISKPVKEQIFAQAREMGYAFIPNQIERKNIAIVVPQLYNTYYSEIIESIITNLDYKTCIVSVHCTYNSFEREKEILSNLDFEQLACLIISKAMDSTDSIRIKAIQDKGIPVMMFNRIDYDVECLKFVFDNYNEAASVTKHLVNSGYKRIAFAAKHYNCPIYREVEQAYRETIEELGLEFDTNLIIHSEHTTEDINNVINRFLSLESPPDALILPNYYAAIVAIHLAKLQGLEVPKDLGIFTIDDEPCSKYNSTTISAVSRPHQQVGADIAEVVTKILNNIKYDNNNLKIYSSNIAVRSSTLRR